MTSDDQRLLVRAHRPRVIPVLLLKQGLLYKSVRFRDAKYVGDPRIAVKIFNDKGADELVLLDITATLERRRPDFNLIQEIASEAFMPIGYGGGIRDQDDVHRIFQLGVEKVVINSHAVESPSFITEAARVNGSQSIVVSIDARKTWFGGYRVMTHSGTRRAKLGPAEFARVMCEAGAGEIMLTSIDRDGTFAGYDLNLIHRVSSAVTIPVIACGGAGGVDDFASAIEAGASAAAAGSLFVFQRPHRAVLITFPDDDKLRAVFSRLKTP